MRDVLYQGKRVDNGEWVEGYYCYNPHMKRAEIFSFDEEQSYVFEVVPESVRFCVGIPDRIGGKVFEKDVVKVFLHSVDSGEPDDIGVVIYRDGAFGIKFSTKFEGCSHFLPLHSVVNFYNGSFEVIGNIVDNPGMEKMSIWDYMRGGSC